MVETRNQEPTERLARKSHTAVLERELNSSARRCKPDGLSNEQYARSPHAFDNFDQVPDFRKTDKNHLLRYGEQARDGIWAHPLPKKRSVYEFQIQERGGVCNSQ